MSVKQVPGGFYDGGETDPEKEAHTTATTALEHALKQRLSREAEQFASSLAERLLDNKTRSLVGRLAKENSSVPIGAGKITVAGWDELPPSRLCVCGHSWYGHDKADGCRACSCESFFEQRKSVFGDK